MKNFQFAIFTLRKVALTLLALTVTVSAESGISARLNRDTVALGSSATLQLEVRGDTLGALTVPQVAGLQLEQIGSSRRNNVSFSFGNAGSASSRETIVQIGFRVVPQRDGSFTIPPFTCEIDGKTYATPPLTLTALKDSAAATQFANAGSPSAATPAAAPAGQTAAIFGKITGVPEKMYVGQITPATVTFYVNRHANLQIGQIGLPSLKHDAFAAPAPRPDEVRQQQDNAYHVFSTVVPLTAIKEGRFELAAEWALTVLVAEEPGGGDESPFNHPLLRGFLGRQTQKSVTVSSERLGVEVLPLPDAERPASFTGAVGRFDATLSAEPAEVRTGDPLTLKISIKGSGNFDRIAAPAPTAGAGWKTYPASAKFESADSTGITGVKIFTQALIPQNEQARILPAVEFSYFDPLTVKYVTVTPPPPPVTVLPAEPGGALARQAAAHGADSALAAQNPALAPIRLEEGAVRADLRPVTGTAWFWMANGGSLLFGLAGFLLLRRHRKTLDADYQARRQTDRHTALALQALDTALANEDSAAFAEAASRALREHLAGLWNLRAESLTTADVRQRLGGEGESALALFEAADAVTYAGRRLSRAEMVDFKRQVREQLNQS
ncbi:MAG: BatD family protein [Verrucomicrobiales bacterium]|jgi:hypothetical protein|nr:BatD family protein [Verrucomicrobiales bacterium]